MVPPKVHDHTTKDLMDGEVDESSISEIRRIMVRKSKEFKEDMQKQLKEMQEKNLRRYRNN
jgi:hypothetical protein